MKRHMFGNGSGGGNIVATQIAPDWVLLAPPEPEPWPDALPLGLNTILQKWCLERPALRIRSTLGIVKDGNLVGIHLWYDPPTEANP